MFVDTITFLRPEEIERDLGVRERGELQEHEIGGQREREHDDPEDAHGGQEVLEEGGLDAHVEEQQNGAEHERYADEREEQGDESGLRVLNRYGYGVVACELGGTGDSPVGAREREHGQVRGMALRRYEQLFDRHADVSRGDKAAAAHGARGEQAVVPGVHHDEHAVACDAVRLDPWRQKIKVCR